MPRGKTTKKSKGPKTVVPSRAPAASSQPKPKAACAAIGLRARSNHMSSRSKSSSPTKAATPPDLPALPKVRCIRVLCTDEEGKNDNIWSIYLMWDDNKRCTQIRLDMLTDVYGDGDYEESDDLRVMTLTDSEYHQPDDAHEDSIIDFNTRLDVDETRGDDDSDSDYKDSDEEEDGSDTQDQEQKAVPLRFFIRELYRRKRDLYESVDMDYRWWVYRVVRDFEKAKLIETNASDEIMDHLKYWYGSEDGPIMDIWNKGTFPDY
ncbi:hypothetical protein AA313_de0203462 [Arthrobotrys entomopaga]|nr:hypothetical protein AA313_de0203462 [Arthrobotrys entomopaga]